MNQAVSFLKDTLTELKLVRWPTYQETLKLTVIVIAISVLVGAYVGGLDLAYTKVLSLVIK